MKRVARPLVWLTVLAVAACSSSPKTDWADEDVSFVADGLTIHGSYRHVPGAAAAPAALLISESGQTDRNGDNAVAGKVGNMRQLAEYLSGKNVDSLRYDKVGTGKTGVGPHAQNLRDVGSAVYTAGAKAAVRFLSTQSGTDTSRISVYGLGEGTVHALALATGQQHQPVAAGVEHTSAGRRRHRPAGHTGHGLGHPEHFASPQLVRLRRNPVRVSIRGHVQPAIGPGQRDERPEGDAPALRPQLAPDQPPTVAHRAGLGGGSSTDGGAPRDLDRRVKGSGGPFGSTASFLTLRGGNSFNPAPKHADAPGVSTS